jgi:hypothetical protein
MLGRIDCGLHRDRRHDTDAEMAIGSAKRYRQAGQGRPRMRPDGRGRPDHVDHLDRLYGLPGPVVTNVTMTCATTIDVPVELHRRIRATCARRGLKVSSVLRDLLEREFPDTSGQFRLPL